MADLTDDERTSLALADWTPLSSRGLPFPHYVDAGSGLRGVDGATAFPAFIALAASFDPALAQEYGAAVGAEARAAGFTVVLGPTLDLARDPRGGRVPEALGEDPYLTGLLGARTFVGSRATGSWSSSSTTSPTTVRPAGRDSARLGAGRLDGRPGFAGGARGRLLPALPRRG